MVRYRAARTAIILVGRWCKHDNIIADFQTHWFDLPIRHSIIRGPNPCLARRLELHVHLAFCQVAFAEEAGGDPAADEGDEKDDRHDDPLVVRLNPERLLVCDRDSGKG